MSSSNDKVEEAKQEVEEKKTEFLKKLEDDGVFVLYLPSILTFNDSL